LVKLVAARSTLVALALLAVTAVATSGADAERSPTSTLSPTAKAASATSSQPSLGELSKEKLEAEVVKVRAEADNSSGVRGFFANYAALIAALAAFAGVGIAVRGQNKEQTRQREADRTQRNQDLAQRHSEGARELTERFSQLLLDLGSDSEPVQAGAAVSLLSFLVHPDAARHHEVRLAVLANLKVEHPLAITKLLIRTFEQAMSSTEQVPLDPIELDFSGAQLFGARLVNLDLDGANLANANFTGADLTGTRLRGANGADVILDGAVLRGECTSLFNARLARAKCVATQFQGAELVNAHLEGANLRNARFEGARLQAAHLEAGTDLRGARFDGANVADTYFRDALFDDDALRSLRKARNWAKAHLSVDTAARFAALASTSSKEVAQRGG
jgi:uncharacterized protein YjbI with pentapeptide repeats